MPSLLTLKQENAGVERLHKTHLSQSTPVQVTQIMLNVFQCVTRSCWAKFHLETNSVCMEEGVFRV